MGRVSKAGAGATYLNPNALAADPSFPATIAVLSQNVAWTHPPIGVIQIYPK